MPHTIFLQNEGTTIARLKMKAETDLMEALIHYRESARAAGRLKLATWAEKSVVSLAMCGSEVNEDLALQDAITKFRNSDKSCVPFAEELLRRFRTTLSERQLEALLAATVATAAE